jgi:hypothetical protein
MKRQTLCLSISLLCLSTSAQIPNAGFETWISAGSFEDAQGWTSFNQYTQLVSVTTVSKTTDAHSGTYAAFAETMSFFNTITSTQDTVAGTMVTGTDILSSVNGFPYILRPDSISAWYKYVLAGSDFAGIGVILSKWNSSSGTRDYIASGEISIIAPAANYTYGSASLSYFMPDFPDTAFIYISASNGSVAFPGSALTVDDISLVTITGVEETPVNNNTDVIAYPNPARGNIKFKLTDNSSFIISICDLTGRMISSISTEGAFIAEADLEGFGVGLYFFIAKKKDGSHSTSGKFCVVK